MTVLPSCLLLATVAIASAQEFVAIPQGDVPQEFSGVELPASCVDGGLEHPHTMYTIEPSPDDQVHVLCYPAGLVFVTSFSAEGIDEGATYLNLKFANDIASVANEGGVKIQIPPAQLERVRACCMSHSQILEGFSAITEIHVSTNSTLRAVLGAGAEMLDILSVTTQATAAIDFAGGTVEKLEASTSSTVGLIAAQVNRVELIAKTNATLQVESAPGFGTLASEASVQLSVADGCNNILNIGNTSHCVAEETVVVPEVTVGEPFTRTGKKACTLASELASTATSGAVAGGRPVFFGLVGGAIAWTLASFLL